MKADPGTGKWGGDAGIWALGRSAAHVGWSSGFFTGLLVMDAAWLIWSRSLPRTHEDYGSKLLSSALVTHLPRLKEIIPAMLVQIAEFQVWGLLWIMAGCWRCWDGGRWHGPMCWPCGFCWECS